MEKSTLCKKCLFEEKGMLAGQAFTEFTCALCDKHDVWGNTNVPKFCYSCSKKLNMCQRCGAPLENEEEQKE